MAVKCERLSSNGSLEVTNSQTFKTQTRTKRTHTHTRLSRFSSRPFSKSSVSHSIYGIISESSQ